MIILILYSAYAFLNSLDLILKTSFEDDLLESHRRGFLSHQKEFWLNNCHYFEIVCEADLLESYRRGFLSLVKEFWLINGHYFEIIFSS